ncbi:MAG: RNA-directed DNA polymerase [Thermoanaerobaculia bacterium]|nr:RNA-directed DNA polymerase [Thermoanaerobaculia bacterium]
MFDLAKFGASKWRHIDNPQGLLRVAQTRLLGNYFSKIEFPPFLFGSIPKRNALQNAEVHEGAPALVHLDIAHCFPSIDNYRIFGVFRRLLGCSEEISSALTRLTTIDGRLPQGAPTSPALANLALLPLTTRLWKLAEANKCRFSCYVDDLHFSGETAPQLADRAIRMVEEEGFSVSIEKIEVVRQDKPMQVTGYRTNRTARASRATIDSVAFQIHDLARKEAISPGQLRSVIARIHGIRTTHPNQAACLLRMADWHLPPTSESAATKASSKFRKCPGFATPHSIAARP